MIKKSSIVCSILLLLSLNATAAPLLLGPGKGLKAPPVEHVVPVDPKSKDPIEEVPAELAAQAYSDPLESINRATYSLNKELDKALLKPAATLYKAVVPSFARLAVSNVLAYLHAPLDVINYALQGNAKMSGDALGRFMLNTLGFGVLDIASEAGIPRKQTGFGETFGVWGAPQGPYIVLPVFGGRSLRGTVGVVGDAHVSPVSHLKANEGAAVLVLDTLDTRTRLLGTEDLISDAALDEYSFVRDALMQREQNRVDDLKE